MAISQPPPSAMPAHRGHHRHLRVAHAQQRVLQLLDHRGNALGAGLHEHRHGLLEIGAGREHIVRRPDHQALVAGFGQFHGLVQAFDDAGADQVQLARDAGDQHFTIQRPQAHLVVLEDLGAGLQRSTEPLLITVSAKYWRWYTGSSLRGA
jgi:hypothetical protein